MLIRPRPRIWIAAACCFLFVGCVTKSVSDAGVSFRYEWWLPIGIFVVGVLFVPIGLALRKHSARYGWGLTIAGPIAALAFAPSLLLERVFVHDQVRHEGQAGSPF